MILVAKVDAAVPRGEDLNARCELGSKVELSGAEHLPVEIKEASAARKKWLDPVAVKEIDLCAYRTPAGTVGIHALAIRLGIAH
jgi:hypothetical protein